MDERAVDVRRRHVLEALSRAQRLAAHGDVQGARGIVDGISEELYAAVTHDARDPDLWARDEKNWRSAGYLLSELSVGATTAGYWRAVVNGLTARCETDDPDLLSAQTSLTNALFQTGDLAGARGLQEGVLAAFERLLPPYQFHLLMAGEFLASTFGEFGDCASAGRLKTAVRAAFERLPDPDHTDQLGEPGRLANRLRNRMRVYGDLKDVRADQEAVFAALERLLSPDDLNLLVLRANLATALFEVGDLQGAREHQEAVLTARERLLPPDHLDLLVARANLANTLQVLGDLAGARRLQESVHATLKRLLPANHIDLLRARASLATTLFKIGDLEGARGHNDAVLAALKGLRPAEHPFQFEVLGNLANTMRELGDLKGARAHEESVLLILERLLRADPDHPRLLSGRAQLAVTLSELGDLALALEHQEAVLAARERLLPADHPDLLSARTHVATTLSQLGDENGVITHRVALCEGSLMVTLRAQAISPREAGAVLQAETNRLSQLRFLGPTPDFAPRLFRGIETLRAVAAPSARRRHFFQGRPDLEGLRRELREAGAALNRLAAGPTGEGDQNAWREQFRQVTQRRDELERTLSREMDAAGVRVAAITYDAVAARLGKSVLVSYFRYTHWELDKERKIVGKGPSLLAHVLLGDGTLHQVELGTIESLLGAINTWRSALEPPRKKRNQPLTKEERAHMAREPEFAASTRELLFDPIVKVLGGWQALASFERIIVVPDDVVHLVPFDALVVPDEFRLDRRLFDVLPVQIEMSLRRFVEEALPLEAGQGLLSVGGVHYDENGAAERDVPLRYLPGTLAEMSAVSRVFESGRKAAVSLLSEARATVEAVKSAVRGKRVVHLATHGWFGLIPSDAFGSRQMRSHVLGAGHQELALAFSPLSLCGLAFAGAGDAAASGDETCGRATGEELATWELGACELAILSACQTNVGAFKAGQGIQSLQTAVHGAGARTALTSLWSVPDEATAMLMSSFCTLAFDSVSGLSVLEAARRAKQQLRDAGYHASGWAGWVLTGDPGPLTLPGD